MVEFNEEPKRRERGKSCRWNFFFLFSFSFSIQQQNNIIIIVNNRSTEKIIFFLVFENKRKNPILARKQIDIGTILFVCVCISQNERKEKNDDGEKKNLRRRNDARLNLANFFSLFWGDFFLSILKIQFFLFTLKLKMIIITEVQKYIIHV